MKAHIMDKVDTPFPESLSNAGGDKKFETLVKVIAEDTPFYTRRSTIIFDMMIEYLCECGHNLKWLIKTNWPPVMNDVAAALCLEAGYTHLSL